MSTNFPTSLDSFATLVDNTDDALASHQNDRADAIEALEAKVGVDSSAVTTSLDYKVNNFFATGRKVYLYENTAPTGWSITAVTDKVLAVKGGADAYNTTGGTAAGTWTQSTHNHQVRNFRALGTVDQFYNSAGTAFNMTTSTISGTTAHSRAATSGQTDPADWWSTKVGTVATYRPYAAVGIICTKA